MHNNIRNGGEGTPLETAIDAVNRVMLLVDRRSISAIARGLGRTRETVSAWMKGTDFDRLKADADQTKADLTERGAGADAAVAEEARQLLRGARVEAARAFIKSVDIAADRGNHKAAKDFLVATGVIEEQPTARPMIVQIGIKLGGVDLPPEPITLPASPAESGREAVFRWTTKEADE